MVPDSWGRNLDPFNFFLGPARIGHSDSDHVFQLDEILDLMARKALKPAFERNEIKGKVHEHTFNVFPDPTLLPRDYTCVRREFVLIPPADYAWLRRMHEDVLILRLEAWKELSFTFKDYVAKCVCKHVSISHHEEGYSVWTVSFSDIHFNAGCYFGRDVCTVARDSDPATWMWKGKEAFCKKLHHCLKCTRAYGCALHDTEIKECPCKKGKEKEEIDE